MKKFSLTDFKGFGELEIFMKLNFLGFEANFDCRILRLTELV